MRAAIEGDTLSVELDSEAETEALGRAMARALSPGDVVGLVGGLGAGKTRLVRAIAEALGADPMAIASPTFVLIHEYEAEPPVFHFDVYRLDSPEQFDALGPDEYFEGPGICLVEWADRVAGRLPPRSWWARFEVVGETSRRVRLTMPGNPAALRAILGGSAAFDRPARTT